LGHGHTPAAVSEEGPSEVKSVAVAFNQMRDDLHRIDQERATFLAGVSHDLRTPLARLRLNVEMLATDPATREDMARDITDVNDVIDQFMDFARDESVEAIEVCDVGAIVQGAADRAARALTSSTSDQQPSDGRIHVRASIANDLRAAVRPLAIRRLIDNLISNAMKHANTDVDIAASRINAAKGGEAIEVKVMDRGPGIAPSEIDRLMRPFTRLDQSRTGASGAGLGLHIVSRIAKLHGGKLDLLPRDGGGTEAVLTIPIR
jgi:two-component system, OmpR family, osmolarity sensor histidine kinase EnvZ